MNTPIEWRVQELQRALTELQQRVNLLEQSPTGRTTEVDDEEAGAAPSPAQRSTPWCVWGYDVGQLEVKAAEIEQWVCWLNSVYGSRRDGKHIPVCWPGHPGLVAELFTLYHSWAGAFLNDRTPDAAQHWHGTSLPTVLGHVSWHVQPGCLSGAHQPARVLRCCRSHSAHGRTLEQASQLEPAHGRSTSVGHS